VPSSVRGQSRICARNASAIGLSRIWPNGPSLRGVLAPLYSRSNCFVARGIAGNRLMSIPLGDASTNTFRD
jgi:hypothetical protein